MNVVCGRKRECFSSEVLFFPVFPPCPFFRSNTVWLLAVIEVHQSTWGQQIMTTDWCHVVPCRSCRPESLFAVAKENRCRNSFFKKNANSPTGVVTSLRLGANGGIAITGENVCTCSDAVQQDLVPDGDRTTWLQALLFKSLLVEDFTFKPLAPLVSLLEKSEIVKVTTCLI